MCFSIQGIERFSIGSMKVASILLVGLFFYDIFWVFGTDVMVTVAKSLDGPIKILFPRSLELNDDGKLQHSLLGLGDIVIPGFLIAMLLRFDAEKAGLPGSFNPFAKFPKPYFTTCVLRRESEGRARSGGGGGSEREADRGGGGALRSLARGLEGARAKRVRRTVLFCGGSGQAGRSSGGVPPNPP
jgi:hypothetical protein